MHSSLTPHLHTPKCNELIALLLQCHKEHPIRKFVGHCNGQNHKVVECLREEREANRAENAAKAKVRQEEVQKKLKNLA